MKNKNEQRKALSDIEYVIPERVTTERLHGLLARKLSLTQEPRRRLTCTYHDTFDWRLYRQGWMLEALNETRLVLREINGERILRTLETSDVPRFAGDLPRGPFRELIETPLAGRALLPMGALDVESRRMSRIDADGKTVLRLSLESARSAAPAARAAYEIRRLIVHPVKGYARPARDARRFVDKKLGFVAADVSRYAGTLAAAGREPGDYTGKPRIPLDPEMRTDVALRRGLLVLFQIIEDNVDGVVGDVDAEFLHDFRIGVRRTRAAIGQIKRVMARRDRDRFKREFKWLGDITGPARDLDVYLEHFEEYEQALAPRHRIALAPFREFLLAHRRAAYELLAQRLKSARWRRLKSAWRAYIEAPVSPRARLANAARPVREVASERIWRVYVLATTDGRRIAANTPVEALHELRIDCKKLRYLLEFFRKLYPARRTTRLIRVLKELQDNLGALQDNAVQARGLQRFARDMKAEGKVAAVTLEAMSKLSARLSEREGQARLEFAARFASFDAKQNRRSFQKLFRSTVGSGASTR